MHDFVNIQETSFGKGIFYNSWPESDRGIDFNFSHSKIYSLKMCYLLKVILQKFASTINMTDNLSRRHDLC